MRERIKDTWQSDSPGLEDPEIRIPGIRPGYPDRRMPKSRVPGWPDNLEHALLCHCAKNARNDRNFFWQFNQYIFFIFSFLSLVFGLTLQAEASVTLKVTASNPSSISERKVDVKSYLPKGIRPENVISSGELSVGYDVQRGQCYVYKEVTLPAEATATYMVEIDDIWTIDQGALEKHRLYTHELRDQLQASEYAGISDQLAVEIEEKIRLILERQEDNVIEKVNPVEHIGAYEKNKEVLESVKEDISTLENMVITLLRAGAVAAAQGGRPSAGVRRSDKGIAQDPLLQKREESSGILDTEDGYQAGEITPSVMDMEKVQRAGCVSQEAARYAQENNISLDQPERAVLTVTAGNPSRTKEQRVPVKYFLDEEIKSNDVLDAGELKVGFDFEESRYYLFKEDVLLKSAEEKVFDVVLRNKWVLDRSYLIALKLHSTDMVIAIEGKEGFYMARQVDEKIQKALDELLTRQGESKLTEQYLESFRADKKKLAETEAVIRELEGMMVEAGVAVAMTASEKERLCEENREKKRKVAAFAGAQGSEAVTEFKLVAGTVFKGKSPSTVVTWKIIYGMIVFLGVISSTFYYVQIKAQKSTMLDPLTGVFSRGYITERFREEIRIAKMTKTNCSLLVLDIDKFKGINDTYGHAVGDVIIKEFVIALRKGVRATDLVGRFGGDEFLVVLPTGEKEKAAKTAEGIVKIIENRVIRIGNQDFKVTTSIGVATFPEDSGTAEDMFNKADSALYEVKRKGGNGVAVA